MTKRSFFPMLFLLLCSALAQETSAAYGDYPFAVKPYAELAKLFEYDHKAPLQASERPMLEREGIKIVDVSYASPAGGAPASAYLVIPPGQGPFAAVILVHSNGGRDAFLPFALDLARAGMIAMAVQPTEADPFDAMLRREVMDLRRARDLLAARADVDSSRIALVGHSMGAMASAVVAGVDHGFRCFIFEAGLSGMTFHLRYSPHPAIMKIRESMPQEKFQTLLASMAPYDAIHYIGHAAPAPLLFQAARFDVGVGEKDYLDFYGAASEPKQLKWYDTAHEMGYDAAVRKDQLEFLTQQLGPKAQVTAERAPLAAEVWTRDLERARESLGKKDQVGYRDALVRLHNDFPGNAHVLHDLAMAEAQLGNDNASIEWLRQYVATGQLPKLENPAFAALQQRHKLDPLRQDIARNSAPVSSGMRAFQLSDPDLLVEDIAYDPNASRIFLNSIRKKKILSCGMTGKCEDFFVGDANSGPVWAILALRVDSRPRLLWATTAAMNAQTGFQESDDGRSEVLKFDLRTGRLLKRFNPADGKKHAMGDMVVSAKGDVFVSDSVSGDVFVIRSGSESLQPLVPSGTFMSPQTPALCPDGSVLFVPDYSAGIAAVRLEDASVTWLRAKLPAAQDGIDGLYCTDHSLVAVQNGARPERIIRFELDEHNIISSWKILEANAPGFASPTHGVLVGNDFYFIVNSGWDRVQDDGSMGAGKPAEIHRMRLR